MTVSEDPQPADNIIDMPGIRPVSRRIMAAVQRPVTDRLEFLAARHACGETRAGLARLFGVAERDVLSWESGSTAIPGPAQILMRLILQEHTDAG